jgi:hypothetical protein
LIPSAKSRDVAGIRFLRSDEQNIVKAVTMEASDGLEIASKQFAMARVQGGDELFGGLFCDFLDLF